MKAPRRGRFPLFGILAIAILPSIGKADLEFNYTALNFPGVQNTLAYGISNSGQIAGYYRDPVTTADGDRGFLFSNGAWTTIYVPSSSSTDIYGINNSGQMAGSYNDATFTTDKGIVVAVGQPATAAPAGSALNEYYGINDGGSIVGSDFSGDTPTGFVNPGPNSTAIVYPNALGTFPHGINNDGSIVGFYKTDSGYNGFLYPSGCPTCFTPIGLPGASSNFAYGINNQNLVVGVTQDSNGNYQGFLFDGTNYTLLDFPGAVNTYAAGINDQDQIVGWYDDSNGNSHGFEAVVAAEPGMAWPLLLALPLLIGRLIFLRRRNLMNRGVPSGPQSA